MKWQEVGKTDKDGNPVVFWKVTQGNASVKLYRRTRGKYVVWEVPDYTGGERRLRSFNDETAARREAERLVRLLASGETYAARFTGKDAAAYGRIQELLRGYSIAPEMAVATFVEALAVLGGNRVVEAAKFFKARNADTITPKTVSEVVELLLSAKASKSQRYRDDLRIRLGRFAQAFQTNVGNVTGPQIQAWLDGLKLAPKSQKNYRAAAWTLFAFAEKRGLIAKGLNPATDTEQVEVTGGEVEILKPEEMARLLACASEETRPLYALCGFCGLRTAEVLRLAWPDIDLPRRIVTVAAAKAKTASRRIIPIADNLAQWLAPYTGRTGKVWQTSPHSFIPRRVEETRAAGLPWKPNALRHSFGSYRLAIVKSAPQVALEMGNSPGMVFRHYREVVSESQGNAWFSIAPEAPGNVVALPTTEPQPAKEARA